jgi:small subunit ribosomal protein S4
MLKGDRCFTPKCAVDRRNRPPGAQKSSRFRRLSDRGVQLREKQKARYVYGMFERQFRRFFETAEKQEGITTDNLLVALERRLDSVVLRLGFADSLSQARQLVEHGHFLLNGRRSDVPSITVKEGDIISWREGSTRTEYYKTLAKTIESKTVAPWLKLDKQTLTGQVINLPTPEEVENKVVSKNIVEYYSR